MGTPWRAQAVRTSIVHRYGGRPIRRAPSGPVVQKQGSDGNPSEPDMTGRTPTDDSTVPYQCTTDIWTYTGPYGTLKYPDGTQQDPTPHQA